MRRIEGLKYLLVFTLPVLTYFSFHARGWWTFAPFIEAFVAIPLLELLFQPNASNISKEEEQKRKSDRYYDLLIYSTIPIQLAFVYFFLVSIREPGLTWLESAGRVNSMGLMC